MRGHAALYRRTGGRVGGRIPGLPSLLLLDHRGARSGKLRTTPLVYMPDGDRFVHVLDTHYPTWREARLELNELPLAAEVWRG